ncbi:MAG: hypothetical protein ACTSPB_03485 [Candidatus Thorarchaeota archaeon]
MRIKEIEYGELRTLRDYNNIRVVMRVKLNENENEDEVFQELIEMVRKKISELADAEDWYIQHLHARRRMLEEDVTAMEKKREKIVEDLLREVRDRLYKSFTGKRIDDHDN